MRGTTTLVCIARQYVHIQCTKCVCATFSINSRSTTIPQEQSALLFFYHNQCQNKDTVCRISPVTHFWFPTIYFSSFTRRGAVSVVFAEDTDVHLNTKLLTVTCVSIKHSEFQTVVFGSITRYRQNTTASTHEWIQTQ